MVEGSIPSVSSFLRIIRCLDDVFGHMLVEIWLYRVGIPFAIVGVKLALYLQVSREGTVVAAE